MRRSTSTFRYTALESSSSESEEVQATTRGKRVPANGTTNHIFATRSSGRAREADIRYSRASDAALLAPPKYRARRDSRASLSSKGVFGALPRVVQTSRESVGGADGHHDGREDAAVIPSAKALKCGVSRPYQL